MRRTSSRRTRCAARQPVFCHSQLPLITDRAVLGLAQWSSASKSWQKIGEVVDAVGSGRKQLFNGVEYDYVFDVDIAEGQPALKLPYNASGAPHPASLSIESRGLGLKPALTTLDPRQPLHRGAGLPPAQRAPALVHRPGRPVHRDQLGQADDWPGCGRQPVR
jgi:hypothetical protein